jgi:hypothetical protein
MRRPFLALLALLAAPSFEKIRAPTRGHGTHTSAAVWERYLEELLAASRGRDQS